MEIYSVKHQQCIWIWPNISISVSSFFDFSYGNSSFKSHNWSTLSTIYYPWEYVTDLLPCLSLSFINLLHHKDTYRRPGFISKTYTKNLLPATEIRALLQVVLKKFMTINISDILISPREIYFGSCRENLTQWLYCTLARETNLNTHAHTLYQVLVSVLDSILAGASCYQHHILFTLM